MSRSRRRFLKVGTTAAAVAATGCANGVDSLWPLVVEPGPAGPFAPPSSEAIDLVSHVINRLSFGPRPGDYERVRGLGATLEEAADAWIAQQLQPERIDDRGAWRLLRRFETWRQPVGELYEYKHRVLLSELAQGTLVSAIRSERQLYEQMVGFWSDHFNIDPSKGDGRWLKTADDWHVVRAHALGTFPALVRASALSPAMLWYLDGRANRAGRPGDRPNENYARELLELHTLGIDAGFTQQDVMDVARCLTGWTVRPKSGFRKGAVEFRPGRHDDGRKIVLGHEIPAGLGAGDLDRVLDIVSLHPATARHLGRKLCARFVADDPPASAVETVAAAFLQHRGDLRATLAALFATDAFRFTRGNKFKRPFRFVVSALRATDATTDAGRPLMTWLTRMGHAPFEYPAPDGYPEEAAPWMGTLLWRWNFAAALAENAIRGTRVGVESLLAETGGEAGLMAHLLGRRPRLDEAAAFRNSGAGLALLLAGPAFQMY